jgi:hypothetical protein
MAAWAATAAMAAWAATVPTKRLSAFSTADAHRCGRAWPLICPMSAPECREWLLIGTHRHRVPSLPCAVDVIQNLRGFVSRGAQVAATTEQASPFLGGHGMLWRGESREDAGHAVYGDCAVVRRHAAMLWTGSDCVTESRCDRCLYPGECDLRRSREMTYRGSGTQGCTCSAAAWAYKVRPPRKPRRCIVRLYKEIKNDLETTRLDVGRVTTVHTVSRASPCSLGSAVGYDQTG